MRPTYDPWLQPLERSSVRSLAFRKGPRARKQRRLDVLKQRAARTAPGESGPSRRGRNYTGAVVPGTGLTLA